MTGIIIMTTASDGINSIGTVIKEYYRSGMIKFFKAITYSFSMNVVALLVSRVVIVILSAIPVIILAMMMGQLSFTTGELFFILSGIIVALVIFALIGVIATELLPKAPLSNIIFYAVIFLSNTFYPLTDFKPAFETIVSFNPITPALNLARGDFQFVPVMIWVGVLMIIQVIVYVNSKVKR
jgi:ABC-2 type transport system permease protein